jgi:outer membrane protein
MKNFIKIFFLLFFFLKFTSLYSEEQKIVYLDIDQVLIQSKAGINAKKALRAQQESEVKRLKKIEEQLKEEEVKIISQKNILSKEDYKTEIDNLRNKAKKYRVDRKKTLDQLTKKNLSLTTNFLKLLTPIIGEYSAKNNISLVVSKKNIIIGKSDLDITKSILEIVNKKISKIDTK